MSNHNKSAKRALKDLLQVVKDHPVMDWELTRDRDFVEVDRGNPWIEKEPSGRETYTIKVVVDRAGDCP